MKDEATPILQQIRGAFGSSCPIPLERVRRWLTVGSLEAQGLLYDLLWNEAAVARIVPPLPKPEAIRYLLSFLRRCVIDDPDSDWAPSRYIALHDLARWFKVAASDSQCEDEAQALQMLLRDLWKEGSEDVRAAVVCGALEHILEDRRTARFFEAWEEDEELASALRTTREWSDRPT